MDTDPETTEGLVGSPVNETEALMEADERELEGDGDGEERTKSMDSMDGNGDKESETSKLLNNTEPHPSRPDQSGGGGGSSGEPKSPKEFSYAYHFKKKYTFRSDSVYSDVTPMSSAPHQSTSSKHSESRDKSGSLSSLKAPQSKWVSLKKKLGKINTLSSKSKSSSSSSSHDEKQEGSDNTTSTAAAPTSTTSGKPIKSLSERRSLLQRAKTLSILPINSAPKKEKEVPKKVVQPPELFNVGGEMNLIPLELLIDINDIKRPK
ncbi:unnamed protein product [Orchesella dallaii]|uniref:Uncharacterized protein n=1 Tax=Orchesella dallaii TaxID=48710 RepID=A0ABP1RWX5_9HEXA